MIKIDELLSDDGFLAECPSGVVVVLSDAAARIAELEKRETHLEEMFRGWRDEAIKASSRIEELEAAIEPFRRVQAITSIYEYVPVEALRDEEEFNFKMTGAEMKRIRAALNGAKK